MVRIQKGHVEVDAVVDLKHIADLGAAAVPDADVMRIGARAVLGDLIADPQIREMFPALAEAASVVGSVQIRNRATLTGNICNASPAADTVPVLMAYGASVAVQGIDGGRTVPLRDFFQGPGKTRCAGDELVTAVHIPVPKQPVGCSFGRLTRRKGVDLATINMACIVDAEGSTSFVFGAAGPTPVFVKDESGRLAEFELDNAADETQAGSEKDALLREFIDKTSPISDVRSGAEYRKAMLLTTAKRVLARAVERRRKAHG